jgi:Stress responsive A/B Barrel Domain
VVIKHIVMWNVSGDDAVARGRNIAVLKAEFESLRDRVPGLLHLEVGVDESRIDYACDVVLYTEFSSREALAAYAHNPEHLRVRRTLGDMRIARHQVDYEVAATDRPRPPAGTLAAGHTTPGDNHVQAL